MIPLKSLDAYLTTNNRPANTNSRHACRESCAACCIAPSISSTTAAMPQGKAAGKACVHLDKNLLCELFATAERPKVCGDFSFDAEVCGTCREEALNNLNWLEASTTNA